MITWEVKEVVGGREGEGKAGFYPEKIFFGGGGSLNSVYAWTIWEERKDFAKGAWRDV